MRNKLKRAGISILVMAMMASAVYALAPVPTAKRAKGYWYQIGAAWNPAFRLQSMSSTAGTKVLEVLSDTGTSVFSVTREGFVGGQMTPGVGAKQTVATNAALTLPLGVGIIPVAGSGGAVTGVTIPNGTQAGQMLMIIGTHATNTVTFSVNGATNINGAHGGTTRVLGLSDTWQLVWDATQTTWDEVSYTSHNQ